MPSTPLGRMRSRVRIMLLAAIGAAAFVPAHASAASTVLVGATASGTPLNWASCGNGHWNATTFVAPKTATVNRIAVQATRDASTTSNGRFELRPLTAGPGSIPADGTPLGTAVVQRTAVPVAPASGWVDAALDSPVTLQGGVPYAAVWSSNYEAPGCEPQAVGGTVITPQNTPNDGSLFAWAATPYGPYSGLFFGFGFRVYSLCADQTLSASFETGTASAAGDCSLAGATYTLDTPPAHGTLGSIAPDGKATYTPSSGYFGADSYSVKATFPGGTTAVYVVAITVAKPAAPSCAGDTLAVAFNTPNTATFSCSGAGLTYSVVTGPARGQLGAISGNAAQYSPLGGAQGSDTFKVRATDVAGQTADDTVAVVIAEPQNVVPDPDDQLTGQDADAAWDLDAAETDTFTLACAPGNVAIDGRVLVQHVDQGTGRTADVLTLESRRTDDRTYRFTLHNPATGRAQGHLAVACLSLSTFKGHQIAVRVAGGNTLAVGPGQAAINPTCGTGEMAIGSGFEVTAGGTAAKVVQTQGSPNSGGRSWLYAFTGAQPATVRVTTSCLSYADAASSLLLQAKTVTGTLTVDAAKTDRATLDCPVGYVGIVGGFATPSVLAGLGQETQARRRLFWFQNTSGTAQSATVSLLCIGLTTATTDSPVVAAGAPSLSVAPPAQGRAGAQAAERADAAVVRRAFAVSTGGKVTVEVTCAGTAPCAGTLTLTAGPKRTAIATASYSAKAGSSTKLTVKLTAKGRVLVRRAKGRKLQVKLHLGATSVPVTLRG